VFDELRRIDVRDDDGRLERRVASARQ
jgi:hypothetical protein